MQRKRIIVASPVEPSGGSWLLNCLLELGIKIGHKPVVDKIWRGSNPRPGAEHIWIGKDGDRFELNPKAAVLMKFLPILTRQTSFVFRDDVEVEYVQDFPPRQSDNRQVVLMVRDPRDAMYSMYRRVEPELSFDEFLRFPNPETLLDRTAHWALFIASWLAWPGVHVVRFEDYKRDAESTLGSVLRALDLNIDDECIAGALDGSSFARAQEAERTFRERFPGDRQIANRAGQVGEGRSHPEVRALIPEMERAAAAVMNTLGYETQIERGDDAFAAARVAARLLDFFAAHEIPAEIRALPVDIGASESFVFGLLSFAHRLDAAVVERAAMPPDEARRLHDSLAEFTRNYSAWVTHRLTSAGAAYADGSAYFFERIREMRQSGKLASSRPPSS